MFIGTYLLLGAVGGVVLAYFGGWPSRVNTDRKRKKRKKRKEMPMRIIIDKVPPNLN